MEDALFKLLELILLVSLTISSLTGLVGVSAGGDSPLAVDLRVSIKHQFGSLLILMKILT